MMSQNESTVISISDARKGAEKVIVSRYSLPKVALDRRGGRFVARAGRALIAAEYFDGALVGETCADGWRCLWDLRCAPERCEAELVAQVQLACALLIAAKRLGCCPGALTAEEFPWGYRVFRLDS